MPGSTSLKPARCLPSIRRPGSSFPSRTPVAVRGPILIKSTSKKSMNAVPFQIHNVFGGLGECHGLVKQDGKLLILEFQVQDSMLNVLKSGVKNLEIPLADVARVTLRRRW